MKRLIFLIFLVATEVRGAEINSLGNVVYYRERAGDSDWWETAVFYQIYPRSFMDSNNDGIGDIKGIIEHLDHLHDMNVTAVWLSPIFKSPQVDQGYDISDYYSIDPDYGTLDDLRDLVDNLHKLGIKIILDFVPNHTSDQHEWFQKSVSDPTGEYGDYYVWKDCEKNGDVVTPPNNWISIFKGPAWEYNEQRKQCYLHQFAVAQPDLNYNNPKVVQAMKDVLTYWLDFGIDGFRCDAVDTLFEDPEFRDEPLSNKTGATENDRDYLVHIYTVDQSQTFDMVYQWRELLDDYTVAHETETKVMMTEAYSTMDKIMPFYGLPDGSRKGAHFPFNFNFITNLGKYFTAQDLNRAIGKWLGNVPKAYTTSNWVLGNHDNHRVATRFGKELIDGMNMVTAILPGVMVTYNGEEIGMEDGEVTCEEGHDPQAIKNCSTFDKVSRDFERTPFHWKNATNAGFNIGAKPWLPVSEKYKEVNLEAQNVDTMTTHYTVYRDLLQMREKYLKDISHYDVVSIIQLSDEVLQILRETQSEELSLVFNIGGSPRVVQYFHKDLNYEVVVASSVSSYKAGDVVPHYLELEPYEGIIVRNQQIVSSANSPRFSFIFLLFLGFTAILR